MPAPGRKSQHRLAYNCWHDAEGWRHHCLSPLLPRRVTPLKPTGRRFPPGCERTSIRTDAGRHRLGLTPFAGDGLVGIRRVPGESAAAVPARTGCRARLNQDVPLPRLRERPGGAEFGPELGVGVRVKVPSPVLGYVSSKFDIAGRRGYPLVGLLRDGCAGPERVAPHQLDDESCNLPRRWTRFGHADGGGPGGDYGA